MRILALALATLVFTSISAALPAADVYVDAGLGSDTTGDGSQTTPWRTVTHALASVSGPGMVVHVAPGLYDAALGEQFPLQIEGGVSIVGAGVDATELRANPLVPVLFNWTVAVAPNTLLADMTLSHGSVGVDTIYASPSLSRLRFDQCQRGAWMDAANLVIEDCEARDCVHGFDFSDSSGVLRDARAVSCQLGLRAVPSVGAASLPRLERYVALSCDTGLAVSVGVNSPNGEFVVRDARIEGCGNGAVISDGGWFGPFDVACFVFERCRISNCAGAGISTQKTALGSSRATQLRSSVIDQCTQGIVAQGKNFGTHAVFVDDSTVTRCGTGLRKFTSAPAKFRLSNSIVWGNAIDLATDDGDFAGVFHAGWADVHGPSITAFGPLHDVDPLFANPTLGDYRLLAGSPLIDVGDPARAPGGTDRDRDPRVLDGRGLGVARIDIGADEHNRVHLSTSGVPVPGAALSFDVDGPAGWAQATAVAAASADLSLGHLGSLLIAPSPMLQLAQSLMPAQFQVTVPPDPALQGAVFQLQSLGIELASGIGSASNAVELAIQ